MKTEAITIDRKQARELYRQYKTHQHYSSPIDHEIQRAYQLIAQGRLVIRALESITAAGVNEHGLPKLAIMRADQQKCRVQMWRDGSALFSQPGWHASRAASLRFSFQRSAFPGIDKGAEAITPLVPIHLRPKRGLANYHILWEAEWRNIVPVDPMLLRRIGKGDMWLVVAAWDLTEVERAALSARLNG